MTDALRLDHFAFRVLDRDAAVRFLTMLGYKPVETFEITLSDGSKASCYAMRHALNPDVFVSSGPEDSLIRNWVNDRGGAGAVHHLAYAVDDVEATMKTWTGLGINFQSNEPLVCSCEDPIVQVFTEPDPTTGIIYELITRNGHPGFCAENVRRLMDSSKVD